MHVENMSVWDDLNNIFKYGYKLQIVIYWIIEILKTV